jgi:hypothetical protein
MTTKKITLNKPLKLTACEKLEVKVKSVLADLGTNFTAIRETLASKKIKGVLGDAEECPIAIYLQKKFPKAEEIEVGGESIAVTVNEVTARIDVPKPILTFLGKFDEGKFKELIHPDSLEDC